MTFKIDFAHLMDLSQERYLLKLTGKKPITASPTYFNTNPSKFTITEAISWEDILIIIAICSTVKLRLSLLIQSSPHREQLSIVWNRYD